MGIRYALSAIKDITFYPSKFLNLYLPFPCPKTISIMPICFILEIRLLAYVGDKFMISNIVFRVNILLAPIESYNALILCLVTFEKCTCSRSTSKSTFSGSKSTFSGSKSIFPHQTQLFLSQNQLFPHQTQLFL